MGIKKLNARQNLKQYNDLLRYAFQVTEKQLLEYGWESEDIRQSKFPVLEKARVLGWCDGERLASQFAVYPLKMNVHGTIYNIGFVTSVATYPEYTGLGLMSKLMRRSLEEMRKKGESLAILYPFSIPLYRHRGWEIISDKMTFRIKDSQLPKHLESEGYVRRVETESPELKRLHNTFAAQTHGCLLRNDLAWKEYWRWDVEDTSVAVYYNAQGQATGYMVYLLRENVMHIKEMIHLDQDAWRGLWKYISAHESMVEEVVGNNYSNEPLAFWLDDGDIRETIRPYIMGRIVDVRQFLEHYRFSPGTRAREFALEVHDPFLEWNTGTFLVRVDRRGRCKVEPGSAKNTVKLSLGMLTTMLFSYKRPLLLQRMGRIQADSRTLDLLESLLPRQKAYISDYI